MTDQLRTGWEIVRKEADSTGKKYLFHFEHDDGRALSIEGRVESEAWYWLGANTRAQPAASEPKPVGTGSDYLDCIYGLGGFSSFGPLDSPAPASEPKPVDEVDFFYILELLYRGGSQGEEPKFTKYNMQIAFEAGRTHPAPAGVEALRKDADCEPEPVTLLQWVEYDRYCPLCNTEIDEIEGAGSSVTAGVVLPTDAAFHRFMADKALEKGPYWVWNACREETARLNGVKP